MSFDKKWDSKNEFSNSNNTIKSSDPLKSRLTASINRIELENQRLEQAAIRFQNRGKTIFDKVVDSYSKHDTARANIYANELAEIRK
ncbi:hypothetical protein FJY84_08575, partial [Candidatus Bathyarchaeota archaeon]|nr:hypothetical protein [Candidatus Bathyarchaeota archaeon]